ncbi:hypothetical protein F6453_3691 [Marinobacter nauticus]|uniref:Uncharacterized protein n=1 Tax=Marinobacter nauticus TaxID=2743 RepID=A0A833N9M8_MARNT|nr:hypothetical protein F6453_3691 [Marinobacter nauticus]
MIEISTRNRDHRIGSFNYDQAMQEVLTNDIIGNFQRHPASLTEPDIKV